MDGEGAVTGAGPEADEEGAAEGGRAREAGLEGGDAETEQLKGHGKTTPTMLKLRTGTTAAKGFGQTGTARAAETLSRTLSLLRDSP